MTITEEADQALEIIKKGIASAKPKAKCQIEDMKLYTKGFAESGYESFSETSKIVVIGNFQPITRYDSNLGRSVIIDDTPFSVGIQLFKMGAHLMLIDEWDACIDCCRVIKKNNKTSWDSKDGLICADCVKSNPRDYVETFVGSVNAITIDIDYSIIDYWRVGGEYKSYWSGTNMKQAMLENGIEKFVFSYSAGNYKIWVAGDTLEQFMGLRAVNSLSYELVEAKNKMTQELAKICPKDFEKVVPIFKL